MTGFPLKSFSLPAVENSAEIQTWLNQFDPEHRAAAQDLVLRLRFVPTDVYREWLKSIVLGLPSKTLAVYAVRNFDRDQPTLWDKKGESIKHRITSRGSEDLVRSVLANLTKLDKRRFYDHPSLNELRGEEINHLVLIDDSIGSGTRTLRYITAVLKNPSFLSWWSYGRTRTVQTSIR